MLYFNGGAHAFKRISDKRKSKQAKHWKRKNDDQENSIFRTSIERH